MASVIYFMFTFITVILQQGITCHPTPTLENTVGLRHYSNESMELLHKLNLSTLILATRDARIGGAIVTYLKERRNRTLWRRRKRNNHTFALVQHTEQKNEGSAEASGEESDEEYEDYEDDYPDFDFSPASIFIYVLEIFGTLIGLTWGAIATLFTAG